MKQSKFKNLSCRLISIVCILLMLCLTHNQVNSQELKSSKGLGIVANATMSKETISIQSSSQGDNGIANISVSNSEISLLSDYDGIINIGNKKHGNRESLTAYEFPQIQTRESKSRASAAVKVSGVIDASTLADNAELVLTGNTNLFMDVNKTLKCITGDYTLTLSGGNILTLNNPEDYAINVLSITISAPLIVKSSNVAISAKNDITINNTVNATSTNTCIGTVNGTISAYWSK